MTCYNPQTLYRCRDQKKLAGSPLGHDVIEAVQVACHDCIGCKMAYGEQWAMRMTDEAQYMRERYHAGSCVVNLTYDDAHLPHDRSLSVRDIQVFMKALRHAYPGRDIRFYCGAEYGETNTRRPHYHVVLMGIEFEDRFCESKSKSDFPIWRSKKLEAIWKNGICWVQEFNTRAAAYAARYATKKVTGERAEAYYQYVDPITGEIFQRTPEFALMSRRPAIGLRWFQKYRGSCFPRDYRVDREGHKHPVPDFYMMLLGREDPGLHDQLKFEREQRGKERAADNIPARLRVKEQVRIAALKSCRKAKL